MAAPQQGPQVERYGAQRGSDTKQLGLEFTAAQSLPTTRLQGLNLSRFAEVQWTITKPSWATSYHLHVMRWKEVRNGLGEVVYSKWVEDEETTETEDTTYYQYVSNDRVMVYVDTIVGVVGAGGFRILYQGVNKPV